MATNFSLIYSSEKRNKNHRFLCARPSTRRCKNPCVRPVRAAMSNPRRLVALEAVTTSIGGWWQIEGFGVQGRCPSLSRDQVLLSCDPKWTERKKVVRGDCRCHALGQMVLLHVWRKTRPTQRSCGTAAQPRAWGTSRGASLQGDD